ncbi:MAG: AmmeMemoRadiSam system protein B [Chloroflexi bacterium]|nr:AmmeMemoRadiSam system protein B [Chloroflexota bacterium]
MSAAQQDIRRSVIAGSWYPGAEAPLRAMVQGFLAQADEADLPCAPVGLIVPHAGYVYSGQVAAHAYRQVAGREVERVVVISPVHRMYAGRYAVTRSAYYETPLGLVEVDAEMVAALAGLVEVNRVGRDNEHSLEIQLPFLQQVLPAAKLLPIMMGAQDLLSCQRLAEAVSQVVAGRKALLVASTDLSHFHTQDGANQLDQVFIRDVEAFAPERLMQHLATGETEACGGGPVATVMLAAKRLGAQQARIVKYATSGDVTGDQSNVVGYAAGVLF